MTHSRTLFYVAVSALLTGCVAFRGENLADVPKAPPTDHAAVPLSYELTFRSFGNPNPAAAVVALDPMVKEFSESRAFSSVEHGNGTPLHVDVTVNNTGNLGTAVLTGALSGLTLTVLPGYARDDYEMTAVVSKGGAVVKRYRYEGSVSTWTQLFLVFGMPFNHRSDAVPETIRVMTRRLVTDMTKDGVVAA